MNAPAALTEEQIAERKELFRYNDLNHPLIQVLLQFQLEATEVQDEI